MNTSIDFSNISANYNDSNSFVIAGLVIENPDVELPDINNFLHAQKLLNDNMKITEARHIDGNVLGDDGRSDYLFVIDNPKDEMMNPMARLMLRQIGLMWTSDFVDNYASDYAA